MRCEMEVNVKREDIVRSLYLLQGVVERRNTQPILSHVLIEPAEGGLSLTATDMQGGVRWQLPAQTKKKGAITLPARKLYEIAREVTAEEMTFRSASEGWVDVAAGRSRFKVSSFEPKDFPELPLGAGSDGGAQIRVGARALRRKSGKALFAVSTDETRVNLSRGFVETAARALFRTS